MTKGGRITIEIMSNLHQLNRNLIERIKEYIYVY